LQSIQDGRLKKIALDQLRIPSESLITVDLSGRGSPYSPTCVLDRVFLKLIKIGLQSLSHERCDPIRSPEQLQGYRVSADTNPHPVTMLPFVGALWIDGSIGWQQSGSRGIGIDRPTLPRDCVWIAIGCDIAEHWRHVHPA
jgi:hypothetical protein